MSESTIRSRHLPRALRVLLALIVATSALVAVPTRAAEPWTTFDIQDGLLRRNVRILAPARDGGVWAGTAGGLNHWNGAHWQSFSEGNGLAPGAITAVVEHGSSIWAGSWGGGLSVLQGMIWFTYRAASSPLPGDWISALAGDDDSLWVATYGAGLAQLRASTWTSFTRANSGLPSDWLTCLLSDGQGGVWVGTERAGLAHLDASGTWQRLSLPPGVAPGLHITALALQNQTLWVGTPHGLAVLDLASQRWRTLGVKDGLPQESVTALAGASHEMWIGTDGGLAHSYDGRMQAYTVREGLPQNAVSAVAVDISGRVWVGTAGRGLAVRGQITKPQVARAPVVLVHGWRGPDSDLLEDSEFWHLARWLAEDGFAPYYATGISPENTLEANAERLRTVIDQVRRESGAPAVYLIGFSMGGLNSRSYVESTYYQGDVLRVFTLGSPHRGEYLWQTFLLWEYLAWRPDPSALELLPLHIDLFNNTHGKAPGVPYTVVAGHARASELPTLFRELPPGDGLVSTWSALGVEGSGVEKRVTQDLHAWAKETILLGIPSLLYPRSTYDAHIRPYLFGVADMPGAGSPDSAEAYGTLEIDPRTGLRTGEVTPGQTVTATVPIDVTGRARLLVRWKDTPLQVTLRDPQGHIMDSGGQENGQHSEYLELGFADFAGYVLTDSVPGPWELVLQNESQKATAQYVAYATLDSPMRLTLRTDHDWYRPGEEVVISAEVVAPAGAASVERVEAEIYDPARQRQVITLQPVQGNSGTSRLMFESHFRAPAQGGYYTVLARAVGLSNNLAFERGEQAVFGVRGDGASLPGDLDLRAQPAEATKTLDLEATVRVDVKREGDYLCSVSLLDRMGEKVTTVAYTSHLQPGQKTVRIRIAGQAIGASGRDGPYRLGEVLLLDVSGAGVLLDRVVGNGASVVFHSTNIRTDRLESLLRRHASAMRFIR